jgi:sulfoxide reductase heme-binding subunit YedZ
MKRLFSRFTPLQMAVHVGAWFSLAHMALDLALGNLSANPIQDLQQRTGRTAITLLILTLACSPLNLLFGWREPLKRRRALGLYTFLYATIHMLIFVDLDYGLAWSLIGRTIVEKPYMLVGVTTFFILLPLAMTSFDIWKRRMGKNWKRLHRLIYLAAPLGVLHYAWSKKGDFFALQGDIVRPLVYAAVLAVLLILRLTAVRRWIGTLRGRILHAFLRLRPHVDRSPTASV